MKVINYAEMGLSAWRLRFKDEVGEDRSQRMTLVRCETCGHAGLPLWQPSVQAPTMVLHKVVLDDDLLVVEQMICTSESNVEACDHCHGTGLQQRKLKTFTGPVLTLVGGEVV